MEDELGQAKSYQRITHLTQQHETGTEIPGEHIKVLRNELDVLKQALESRNMDDVLNVLTDMQYFIYNNVQQLGLQERFADLFEEVSVTSSYTDKEKA